MAKKNVKNVEEIEVSKKIEEQDTEKELKYYKTMHEVAELQVENELAIRELAKAEAKKLENTEPTEEEKQEMLAEAYKLTGRVEGLSVVSKFLTVSTLVTLKNIKESKIYKEIKDCETWEKYCQSIGYSRAKVDLDLESLSVFGSEFLLTISNFGLSYRELRQLKQAKKDNSLKIEEDSIIIEGEVIQLDDKDYLKDALTDLIANQQKELQEHRQELQAKDEVVKRYMNQAEIASKAMKSAEEKEDQANKKAEEYKAQLTNIFNGRLGDVADEDREDFQDLVNLENDLSSMLNAILKISDRDLSKFNETMFCGLISKAMITIDNIRINTAKKYGYEYDNGFLDDDDKKQEHMTPKGFLNKD